MASVNDILLEQARQVGEARRSRGALIGQSVAQIGQIPGQIIAAREDSQRRDTALALQQQEAARKAAADKHISERDDARLDLDTAKYTSEQDAKNHETILREAVNVADNGYKPAGVDMVFARLRKMHEGSPDAAQLDEVGKTPEGRKAIIDGLIATAPKQKPSYKGFTSEQTIIDENAPAGTPPVQTGAPKLTYGTPTPMMVGGRRIPVRPGSDGKSYDMQGRPVTGDIAPDVPPLTAAQIEDARHNVAMEARAPVGGQPSLQAKEVLGDDGKPVMATFDPRTSAWKTPTGEPIKNPRPVPSAMENMDARKFDKAAPILKSIEELSERINTQAGAIAKISGAVEKAKAKANYDDDVAEYTALVSGFTPLVARSLGHTGVLTEQDVQSVKELFPKPGDSKTLRDRKLARIKTIMGELENTERNATPRPTAAPKKIGRFEVEVTP